ncbi:MAG: hypothetical protein HUJ31_10095 [Pseudomonadales bacterium]|nr:hypothetical protein [Pseudomonadales bacterium]
MNFRQLPVLLRRELQEHRAALLITPFVIICFMTLVILVGLFLIEFGVDVRVSGDMRFEGDDGVVIEHLDGVPLGESFANYVLAFSHESSFERQRKMTGILAGAMSPLILTLWVVIFFYLLGALYDDRKDRSILFWKSMPVSDAMTIVSKLLTAVVVAPAIYLVSIVVVHVVFMLTLSVAVAGLPIEIWDTFWKPAGLVGKWMSLLAWFLFGALWCLQFYGCLLLVSSFARSIPFVWAVGIPAGVVIVERIFTIDNVVGQWMGRHVFRTSYDDEQFFNVLDALPLLASVEFVITLVVGGALLYGAILMRGRGDEI